MNLPIPKPPYQVSKTGERPFGYSDSGRFPEYPHDYEDKLGRLTRDQMIDALPALLRSSDVGDRIRAYAFLRRLRSTLPAGTWLVVETLDSPNLQRSVVPPHAKRLEDRTWSAHVDRADAEAWCLDIQTSCDKQHSPNWGPDARRHFGVVQCEESDLVSVSYLRQPGASVVYNQAFKR